MRRGRVERPPVLLHVLAVIALGVGETEQSLFQDRVVAVPQRHAEAQVLPPIAQPRDAVLAPPVRARARVIVGERVPRGSAGAVVLTHGPPLPSRDVRPPPLPPRRPVAVVVQPLLLSIAPHGRTVCPTPCLVARMLGGSWAYDPLIHPTFARGRARSTGRGRGRRAPSRGRTGWRVKGRDAGRSRVRVRASARRGCATGGRARTRAHHRH